MTQVILDFDSREWAVDTEEITLAQAFMIKDSTKDGGTWPSGRPLQPWLAGVSAGDPACLRAMYWLMLQQDGQHVPIATLEFAAMKYHTAWVLADTLATADAERLRLLISETERHLEPLRNALELAEQKEAAHAAAAAAEGAYTTAGFGVTSVREARVDHDPETLRGTAVTARARELTRRFWSEESDLRHERDMHLALLAAWCHVPPGQVNDLTMRDFVLLVTFVERKKKARMEGGDL